MDQSTINEAVPLDGPLIIWQHLLGRLYHEDDLMNQRMYHFWTVQAFLAAALALGNGSARSGGREIQFLVDLFGLTLAMFYIPLGLAYVRGLQCIKTYLIYLESLPGIPRINSGAASFLMSGKVEIDKSTQIVTAKSWFARPIYQVFPWYFGLSASMFIGVGTPVLATLFWLFVMIALRGWVRDFDRIVPWISALLISAFLINLALGRLIPGRPRIAKSADT
jgi:hypothetical protein